MNGFRTSTSVAHFIFFIYQHKKVDGSNYKPWSNAVFEWNSSDKHDVGYTWARIRSSHVAVWSADKYQIRYWGNMQIVYCTTRVHSEAECDISLLVVLLQILFDCVTVVETADFDVYSRSYCICWYLLPHGWISVGV